MFSQPTIDSYQEKFSHLIKTAGSKDQHQASNPPLAEVKPIYQQQAKDTSVKELPSGYKPSNKYFHAQFRLQVDARTFVPDKKVFDAAFRPRYIVSLENNFKDLELICHSKGGDVNEEMKTLKAKMVEHGLMGDWSAACKFIDDSPEPKLGKPPVNVVGP
ncbi:hypothetical protein NW752_001736 [Fusarium irregulare]|uniref:Uncharacterized protein n=1 Tax=Fusarium irregulare TaxID=2494466 RepID=A0A9W8PVD4_9HYPO|nr:hypothetical protein NW766_003899 [Fusarium irregulare]KAJ4026781.1 hypothetical protein NW752_001736 [Fusarium irregulare]